MLWPSECCCNMLDRSTYFMLWPVASLSIGHQTTIQQYLYPFSPVLVFGGFSTIRPKSSNMSNAIGHGWPMGGVAMGGQCSVSTFSCNNIIGSKCWDCLTTGFISLYIYNILVIERTLYWLSCHFASGYVNTVMT